MVLFSLIGHELAHCLVAREFNYDTKDITIMALGGVAQIARASKMSAKENFLMSIAGPTFNLFCVIILFIPAIILINTFLGLTICYAMAINLIMFGFNMLPAYPLDGSRVFGAVIEYFFGKQKSILMTTWISLASGVCICFFGGISGSIFILIIGFIVCFISSPALIRKIQNTFRFKNDRFNV